MEPWFSYLKSIKKLIWTYLFINNLRLLFELKVHLLEFLPIIYVQEIMWEIKIHQ